MAKTKKVAFTDFKKFPIEYGGRSYVAEFDTDTIRKAEDLGVLGMDNQPIRMTQTIFFCSLVKHNPFMTQKKANELFDEIFSDEEYGISAFSDIVDEWSEKYRLLFTGTGEEKKKKKFAAEAPVEVSVPND